MAGPQDRRSPGPMAGRASIPRWREAERERRQAVHGGARSLWEARSACGEAVGSAARESAGAAGRHSVGNRVTGPGAGGHHTSRDDCVARAKRLEIAEVTPILMENRER